MFPGKQLCQSTGHEERTGKIVGPMMVRQYLEIYKLRKRGETVKEITKRKPKLEHVKIKALKHKHTWDRS